MEDKYHRPHRLEIGHQLDSGELRFVSVGVFPTWAAVMAEYKSRYPRQMTVHRTVPVHLETASEFALCGEEADCPHSIHSPEVNFCFAFKECVKTKAQNVRERRANQAPPAPKHVEEHCIDCGRPRSCGSAARCRQCYERAGKSVTPTL